jgi:6-phosphogluconolactonase
MISRVAFAITIETARHSVQSRGEFSLCLSGGNTPQGLYELFGRPENRAQIDWPRTHVFWGDERCIGSDKPDNHFRMATELFLSRVPIPPEHVHRIRAEASDVRAAALEYERDIRQHFRLGDGQFPAFDLNILGLGDDAHTASLYPDTEALSARDRIAVANFVPQRSGYRITLTFSALNQSRRLMFLIAGAAKRGALRHALGGPPTLQYPVTCVAPVSEDVLWVADAEAARGVV